MNRRGVIVALVLAACGGDNTGPSNVSYGQTTMVYLLNPVVNDVSIAPVAMPGTTRAGVDVAVDGGPSGVTSTNGDVVLGPLSAGTKTVAFAHGSTNGQLSLPIAEGDLREIAVALDGSGAAEMANVRYAFGGAVVEIAPTMTIAEVNSALAGSNVIVFFRSGTYSGDLVFSGSNVTLFGEGSQGGTVTIDGNVTVTGSQNRIRGARITGTLSVLGSDAGVSYSRVAGDVTIEGSDAVLLSNAFCGAATVSGSGALALGNAGLAPLSAPTGGC